MSTREEREKRQAELAEALVPREELEELTAPVAVNVPQPFAGMVDEVNRALTQCMAPTIWHGEIVGEKRITDVSEVKMGWVIAFLYLGDDPDLLAVGYGPKYATAKRVLAVSEDALLVRGDNPVGVASDWIPKADVEVLARAVWAAAPPGPDGLLAPRMLGPTADWSQPVPFESLYMASEQLSPPQRAMLEKYTAWLILAHTDEWVAPLEDGSGETITVRLRMRPPGGGEEVTLDFTSIRPRQGKPVQMTTGATARHLVTATALYPVADNSYDLGDPTLGVRRLLLSDARTTDPSNEGEVIAHGNHHVLAVYLGSTRQYTASLQDDALIADDTTFTTGGALAATNLTTRTLASPLNYPGNVFRVVARGVAFINPLASPNPAAVLTLSLRIESTDVCEESWTYPAGGNQAWIAWMFEADCVVRSTTTLEVTMAKLTCQDWSADPWAGGYDFDSADIIIGTYDGNVATAGAIDTHVRATIVSASGGDTSYVTVRTHQIGPEQM